MNCSAYSELGDFAGAIGCEATCRKVRIAWPYRFPPPHVEEFPDFRTILNPEKALFGFSENQLQSF